MSLRDRFAYGIQFDKRQLPGSGIIRTGQFWFTRLRTTHYSTHYNLCSINKTGR
jgi:hypothetical protein